MSKTYSTFKSTMATSAKKRGKKRAGGGRRPAGEDLSSYIAKALGKSRGAMGITAIASAVKKAGYRTASAQFKGIVAMRLSTNRRFKRVSRGMYTLGKKGK